jgi:predicted nucleic acid-binding Zn ribbon protein
MATATSSCRWPAIGKPVAYPKPIADILSQLIARRGYARQQSTAALETAWRQAVGEQFARTTRVGSVRRGVLEVTVANNLVSQELGFQKADLTRRLQQLAPDETITNIRFRVGSMAATEPASKHKT